MSLYVRCQAHDAINACTVFIVWACIFLCCFMKCVRVTSFIDRYVGSMVMHGNHILFGCVHLICRIVCCTVFKYC